MSDVPEVKLVPCTVADYPQTSEVRRTLGLNRTSTVFRVLHEGQVVGFCGYYLSQGKLFLGEDYTLPEYRGRGFHRAAVRARLKRCGDLGARVVYARCNPMSLPTYEKEGFSVIAFTKNSATVRRVL